MTPSSGQETEALAAHQGFWTRIGRRADKAIAEAEREGLMLAAKVRTVALSVVLLWQFVDVGSNALSLLFGVAIVSSFIALGLLHYFCVRQRFYVGVLNYFFVALDYALLAFVFTVQNPFEPTDVPATFAMHGSPYSFFFVFLMQSTFSFQPTLVLWSGFCMILSRTGMLLWTVAQPNVFTTLNPEVRSLQDQIISASDPNYVHLTYWGIEVIAGLLVAAGLAVVAIRSRQLVETHSIAERERSNLARYFSPNVVDQLSQSSELLRRVREQRVAVLFADIMGFTELCEKESPERVIALLRAYHNRLGQAVFDNGGTLDKYMGDGLMATFGTPQPTPNDACNALQCAADMITALEKWNEERERVGDSPIRVGIGVHYGPAIAGDIGNERRLEYSVIGDTVNIASRLEHLTRELETPLVVSTTLIDAISDDDVKGQALIRKLSEAGVQKIRGREHGVSVMTLNARMSF